MEHLLALKRFQTVEFKIMAQTQEPRQLKDYDVLGVGAGRRDLLVREPGTKVLLTHPCLVPASQRPLYEAILQETLGWLKPQEVRQAQSLNLPPEDSLYPLLLEDFQREFPQTSIYLKQKLPEVMKSYLRDFPWQGPLLSDHFRYFPAFLKKNFQDSRLYWIAQKEWLCSYLSFAEFGFPAHQEGRLFVNPSLQVLYSFVEIEEVQLRPGLFVFYYDFFQQKIREHQLSVEDAAVVDLLQEERAYTIDQALEQLLIRGFNMSLSQDEWRKKLFYLKSEGILLESGSKNMECL